MDSTFLFQNQDESWSFFQEKYLLLNINFTPLAFSLRKTKEKEKFFLKILCNENRKRRMHHVLCMLRLHFSSENNSNFQFFMREKKYPKNNTTKTVKLTREVSNSRNFSTQNKKSYKKSWRQSWKFH
jgi:long-subunit acyl-CoA synthetase (AMP-forming)